MAIERPKIAVADIAALVEQAREVLAGPSREGAERAAHERRIARDLQRIAAVVYQARRVVEEGACARAAELDTEPGKAPSPRQLMLEQARTVISETVRSYSDWSAKRLAAASPMLEPFDGLPVQFDILSLMGVDGNEAVFCRLLAWLLDPTGSHGVGDHFLRLFLARLGVACHGRILDYGRPLYAEVVSELSWDVPSEEPFKRVEEHDEPLTPPGRSRKLRVDILLIVPGYVIPIEVKVYARESRYAFRGETWQQAALYGRMWELMLDAQRSAASPHHAQPAISSAWPLALRNCLDACAGLRDRAHYLDGGRATVVPVLIHSRHRCANYDQPIGQRTNEHGLAVLHLRWLDIDRMLHRLSQSRDLQAGRLDLIRSFRTTILRLATGTNLVSHIEDLRLRIAEPTLTRRFPIASTATLKTAIRSLEHVDTCCLNFESANSPQVSG